MRTGTASILAAGLGTLCVCLAASAPLSSTTMSTTTFFKGSGSGTVLFNAKGGTFYDGQGTSTVLLNLSGSDLPLVFTPI